MKVKMFRYIEFCKKVGKIMKERQMKKGSVKKELSMFEKEQIKDTLN